MISLGRDGRHKAGAFAMLAGLLLAMGALVSSAVRADPLDGALEIQSAFVNVSNGVYQLHVRTRYPLNEETDTALRSGVSLSYELEVEVVRERRFWTNATVMSLRLKRELGFHSVSERYVVRDPLGDGEQKSYSTLQAALAELGIVEAWPILVASQVSTAGNYQVRVRARVRQGRMSDALRALMFWSDDWQRESEWYTWSLQR
jgi:hypothetical protein